MRLAILGCGNRVQVSILPTLSENPDIRITALIDPSRAALLEACTCLRSLGVPMEEKVQLLPEDEGLSPMAVNAVLVASPHAFHAPQTRRWLQRGKPVFVEKPLACHPEDAAALVELSRGIGLSLSEPRRFRADLQAVRDILRSGAIGRLHKIRSEDYVRKARHFQRSWRNDPALAGGGVLLDLGCHTLASLLWTCGLRTLSLERIDLQRGACQVETKALLLLQGPRVEAEVVVGLVNDRAGWERLILWGETGSLRLFRSRQDGGVSRVEVVSRARIHRFNLRSGDGFESASLRRFLRSPDLCEPDAFECHIEALRLIRQAYQTAGGPRLAEPAVPERCHAQDR